MQVDPSQNIPAQRVVTRATTLPLAAEAPLPTATQAASLPLGRHTEIVAGAGMEPPAAAEPVKKTRKPRTPRVVANVDGVQLTSDELTILGRITINAMKLGLSPAAYMERDVEERRVWEKLNNKKAAATAELVDVAYEDLED